jgi:hypothetical protein
MERWIRTAPISISTAAAVDLITGRLREDGRVRIAYLFGSRGGENHPPSADLDIGLYTEGDLSWDDLISLNCALTGKLHSDRLDLVWLNAADPVISFEVIRSGKVLFHADADTLNDYELKLDTQIRGWKKMKHHASRRSLSGIFSAIFACAIAVTAFGCASVKKGREGLLFKPVSAAEKDITVSLREVGRDELVERFRTVDNPYLPPGSLVGGDEMIVFELTISAPSEIKLILKSIEFHFGSYFTHPTSRFRLSQEWEFRIQRQDAYNGWTGARVTQIINRTMVPDKLVLRPNESYTGFLVFMGRFPTYGEASIYLPVFTKNDELIHLFEL